MQKRSKGWGFAIDYAKTIAEDEKNLAIYLDPIQVALCQTVTPAEYRGASGYVTGMAWIDHLTYRCDEQRWRTREEVAPLLAIVGLTLAQLHALALYGANDAFSERLDVMLAPEERRPYRDAYTEGKALSASHGYLLELGRYMLEAGRKAKVSYWRGELARHKRNRAKHGA